MQIAPRNILIINGSIRGASGNSGKLAAAAVGLLNAKEGITVSVLTLTDPMPSVQDVYDLLIRHDGFLLITGVYWNNWSAALQRFIEVVSVFENTPAFFGKPVACAASMDSVGGLEVVARLHAVWSGLGGWSPPCSTLVISRTGQEAIAATAGNVDDPNEDVWRIDDLAIVLDNLIVATNFDHQSWKSWPHAALKMTANTWPSTGPLDLGSAQFL